MIIGIDGNEANIEKRVGVNEYAHKLIINLHKLQDEWKDRHEVVVYLKNPPINLPKETAHFKYKVLSGGSVWIITKLMPHLMTTDDKPDVFFAPSHYLPPIANLPMVCSIMDLGYLESSGQFTTYDYWQLKLWTARSINISNKVIAISSATKDDIVDHYSKAKKKVVVTPLGYDNTLYKKGIATSKIKSVYAKYKLDVMGFGKYILFLGTLKPSKNIEGIVEGFSKISKNYPEVGLVIAGKKGWLYEQIFEKVKKLNLDDKVVFTGFIDEEDKPSLIKGAEIFAIPSFWEGFGLDVLSAMAVGTPVLTSDKGSLPEVAGKAAIYVNPDKPSSIAKGMEKILNMNQYEKEKLINKGYEQANKFSWEKTARETLKVLESAKKS